MTDGQAPRSYPKAITLALVLLNLAAIAYAIYDAEPGQADYHFREGYLITWLGAAEMLGAALLFVACFFASNLIPHEQHTRRDSYGWLVFAAGFFVLALDQQFRLREALTAIIEGAPPQEPTATHVALKVVVALVAAALVLRFRVLVLANFRMVLSFGAGFWFLALMLIFDVLFESVGLPRPAVAIMEGSAKLLALAMFLTAPYVALLDRLDEARALARRGGLLRAARAAREEALEEGASAEELGAAGSEVEDLEVGTPEAEAARAEEPAPSPAATTAEESAPAPAATTAEESAPAPAAAVKAEGPAAAAAATAEESAPAPAAAAAKAEEPAPSATAAATAGEQAPVVVATSEAPAPGEVTTSEAPAPAKAAAAHAPVASAAAADAEPKASSTTGTAGDPPPATQAADPEKPA